MGNRRLRKVRPCPGAHLVGKCEEPEYDPGHLIREPQLLTTLHRWLKVPLEQKFDSHIINKNQLKYRKQNAYILKKMTGFNDVGREKK